MAQSFIGKPISLISHSDVRYRGILAGIDPAASTIQLSNVYSMGTESRRPPAEFIPPVQEPYSYIIFRASEVKDLAVDEPVRNRSVHDDPAVLAAPHPEQPPPPPPAPAPRRPTNNSVHTAAASLETVERALGDLRSTRGGGRGRGARGGHHHHAQGTGISVPTTDFDFASMNAKFDKVALGGEDKHRGQGQGQGQEKENDKGQENNNTEDEPDATTPGAYDPTKSFFDSLTFTTGASARGRRGGGRGSRREEERERNVATFGEPGGVGAGAGMGVGMGGVGWAYRGRRARGRR